MFGLMRKWFARKPYVPVAFQKVTPKVIDAKLHNMRKEIDERIEIRTQESKTLAASVVHMHDDLLKLLGQRV